ncbi:hypothetical protein OKW21_004110 [Catalinimonas alkaloidigena]|uniref:hypothetical protein n=1 Tax=Catalinimonas alkaloidigena TaxID=1075417 RepID=UPI00240742FD|nr:hypothetical protein [Catalinimonas alkaloidigena]MDF9798847.1 hypothetical protein [Catalinimonas alkaloidigena]
MKKNNYLILLLFVLSWIVSSAFLPAPKKTVVTIQGEAFYVNGKPTYQGRSWKGKKIEGLLMNSRMVQGIFDDLNPETRKLFGYPDTGEWDPNRNTAEFVDAMDEWKAHGLNSFTINMQGGSPTGYGNKEWYNSPFYADGQLRPEYMNRLKLVLDKADALEMVVMMGIFYFGQDQNLEDEQAVINAVNNTVNWVLKEGYQNVLIEVNNECNIKAYEHDILKPDRVDELIELVKSIEHNGHRLLVSTSYGGNTIPLSNVVKASDYILIHGNGVDTTEKMENLIRNTRKVDGYRPMPVVVNEDDNYDFDNAKNNFSVAVENYVSWGYFDYRRDGEAYEEGYQSVPVDWGINSERKKGFFSLVKEITGGKF